jgi:hypothetical protein
MSNAPNPVFSWGRSLAEYQRMFQLSAQDLNSRILGCGDGPASFNAEMNQLGHKVISVDPAYALTKEQIQGRMEEAQDIIIGYCKARPGKFAWSCFRDPDDLCRHRLQVMRTFLQDFDAGVKERRYVTDSLPSLGFAGREFDLALCSHLLFLYSDWLSLEFHLASIREMCRVAGEVRIFPLVDRNSKKSRHLKPVIRQLNREGFSAEVVKVPYEFLRGGNKMLKVSPSPLPPDRPAKHWLHKATKEISKYWRHKRERRQSRLIFPRYRTTS